jgi:hypothetical protein
MSIPVPVSELPAALDEFGMVAYLLSAGADGRPRSVSVAVTWLDDVLVATVGRRTAANITVQPLVALLWPGTTGGEWSLIVDAVATTDSGAHSDGPTNVRLSPTSGVRHKNAVTT